MNARNDQGRHDRQIPHDAEGEWLQILDADGEVLPGASIPDVSDADLHAMYEDLKLARYFDQQAITYQRQGRIATYAPMTGQEGSQIASSHAMCEADWLFPTYREHAAKYARGVALSSLLQSMRGYREGYAVPDDVNVMPEYIPIATQVPQAMGMAWGFRMQEEADRMQEEEANRAVVCHLGDGATSEGDFHEGLNFAGVFDVPVVFICNNNQWAISTPTERQTASETIAQKAQAYGIEGVTVDGLDPLAVYEATSAALDKAKDPGPEERRPTLIESVQYRYGAHTTADDPTVYRDGTDEEFWRERDPVDRFERFLFDRGILTDAEKAAVEERIEQTVDEAMAVAENTETDPDRIVEHVYETVPDRLADQREELNRIRDKYGDGAFADVLE